ncbi:amino acid adenylation domain-containing protein [Gordonia sp. CPCC 205333]|uniref:amino acid adenylation domain-containing protein n=1 Tax=Gordonia sp. CPCC 205333 TaxID=3140790 RepID=UPI003AF3DEC6
MADELPVDETATSISVCRNGPLLVRGDFHLLNDEGSPLAGDRKTIALCRCGHSERKPFCDGSHRRYWPIEPAPDGPLIHSTLPLTAAQQSLWFAQQLIGAVPLAIAHVIDLSGQVDTDIVVAASDQAGREFGITSARIVDTEDGPQISLSRRDFVIDEIDCRQEYQPIESARAWMDQACTRPMNLHSDALVQTSLLRVADDRWFLFSRAHHIVLDGYGALKLIQRTAELYRAAKRGMASEEIAAPSSTIGDPRTLVDADNEYATSARRQRDRDYWRDVVSALPDPVTIGIGRHTPSVQPIRVGGRLGRGPASAIEHCSTRLRALPSAVVIAGLAAYLSRVTDRNRIVLSLPVSARHNAAVRSVAGSMSNIVPLVVTASAELTIDDYVAQVSRGLSGLLRHQRYRHEDMLRDAGVVAAGLHQFGPVVNVFPFDPLIPLGDIDADYTVLRTGPVADLNVNLYPAPDGGSRIEVEGNPAGFVPGALAAHHDQLVDFLERFASLPTATPIGTLTFGSRPLVGVESPIASTLAQLLERAPNDDTSAVKSSSGNLTYRDLRTRATEFATRLRAAGVRPESAVAVVLPRSPESVIALWAVALAGGIHVPIDPRYPQTRVDQIIASCEPRVIIRRGLSIDARGAGRPDRANRPDNAAYEIFTSGSTGVPKGVVVSGSGLAALVAEIDASYRLGTDCVIAHFASTSFDTAFVEVVAALVSGARLCVIDPHIVGGDELATALNRGGVTHLLITPAALATLDPPAIPTVRDVIVGGDVCPPSVARRWVDSGVRLRCAYGPTETTCSVTITPALDVAASAQRVPIGIPMPGVTCWVLDARLRPQPVGAVGELYVGGPSLARGYQSGAATAAHFVANPFGHNGSRLYRSGDIVSRRADGSLDFVGRTDHQLKIRGFRVETNEIDAVLRTVSDVEDAVTIPLSRGTTTVLASYVTGRGLSASTVRSALTRILPGFLLPSAITVLPEMPLTTNGKIDRSALPAPTFAAEIAYRPPHTPDESACVEAFSAVTAIDTIGVDHDFFSIGGDSLSATTVVAKINRTLGTALTVRDIFDGRTPAGVAALITSPEPTLTHIESGELVALTPAQRNVDRDDRSVSNLMPFAVHLPEVDRARLADAVAALGIAHHILTVGFSGEFMIPDAVPAPALVEITGSVTEFAQRGFDLSAESALRIGLRDNSIAICAHHAAIDGASLRIILTDLVAAYYGQPLNRPRIDYLDYARWMGTFLGDPGDPTSRHSRQLAYWRQALDGIVPLGDIDGRRRPTSSITAGATISAELPASLWERTRAIAIDSQSTPLGVVRAAVALVVAKHAQSPDLVIGTPIAGRRSAQVNPVVGMFVNTLPLRYRIADGTTVAAIVGDHIQAEREAFRHSDVGYVDIAAAVKDLDGPHHPLFQLVVSAESTDAAAEIDLGPQRSLRVEPLPVRIAKCDLHVAVTAPTNSQPGSLEILYPAETFKIGEVRDLIGEVIDRLGS